MHAMKPRVLNAAAGALGVVFLAAGCGREPVEPAMPPGVVAKVAGQDITLEALRSEVARHGRLASDVGGESNRVRLALEDLIRFEVLYSRAIAAGYGQKPEVQAAIKRLIVARFREGLETNRDAFRPPTEEAIADYYRRHPDRFGAPEQVRAAVIHLAVASTATPEERAEARRRAEALRVQAVAGAAGEATFGLLAHTNSAHQATRYRGGDLGWLTRESAGREWERTLVEALFALQTPGQVSPVAQGQDGFYLFRLTERKAAAVKPLAEVREGIAYRLAREERDRQQEKLYAELASGVAIRINESALAPLMTNAPPPRTPPSFPSR